MLEKRFLVNPLKFVAALATALVSLVIAVCLVMIGRYGSALVFAVICALFTPVALFFGATLRISEDGVSHAILGHVTRHMNWDEIREIGVAGTNVFNGKDKKRTGTLYIYFSKEQLDDKARFDMMFKWPVRDKLFMEYTAERIQAVQARWSSLIETYNAGDLRFS